MSVFVRELSGNEVVKIMSRYKETCTKGQKSIAELASEYQFLSCNESLDQPEPTSIKRNFPDSFRVQVKKVSFFPCYWLANSQSFLKLSFSFSLIFQDFHPSF